MKNISTINSEAGFGIWGLLLFLVLVGLIIAAVMKTISVWVAVGLFFLAVILIGILANAPDIKRYARISSM